MKTFAIFGFISLLFLNVFAAPASVDEIESVANATALGIDVYGPIPDDAVLTPEGYYSAQPGTKAWSWIRAQIDLPPRSENALDTREWANIGIGMFAQDWCNGEAAWFDNVEYGNVVYVSHVNMFSVGISYRGLRDNEHLDFSKLLGSDWCGQYCYSAGKNTPIGCFNSQLINCFRLWHD